MTERKPEQLLNDKLRPALAGWDPVRVENVVGDGTPDINYIGGWIESKTIQDWPKRRGTVVELRHYVTAQRGWHAKRRHAGGRVHVVLEVRDQDAVLVFDAARAALHLGIDWTRQDCCANADFMCAPWNPKAFRRYIESLDQDRYR